MRFLFILCLTGFLHCAPRKDNHGKNISTQNATKEIPVLCYHNIRSVLDHHSPELTVTEQTFDDQMKMLHDSGYHTILPDQLYNYLTKESALPSKPIMLSFDDSHEEHFSVAAKEMEKYGFRGVFFVMTIAIDKPNYLSSQEINALASNGHVIACHTYDHPLLTRLKDDDWNKEIDRPKKLLEQITGKPSELFCLSLRSLE